MRIFLAGATGALGRRLVPMLVGDGHSVVGTTRHEDKMAELAAAGAAPALMNALDAASVHAALAKAQPDAVISQLTALKNARNLKKFDDELAETNRLRTKGTDHLLDAARAAGAARFIAQSFTGWPNERSGARVKNESDPLDADPVPAARSTVAAISYVETVVPAAPGMAGVVLRYGSFYGPGTSLGEGGDLLAMVRRRRLPVVGAGTGVWSMIHVDDAARATRCALHRGEAGLYNIVDDEPAEVAEWLPYLAKCVGAKPPMRLPAWLVKPMIGEQGVSLMTQIRGSSNAKAKRELDWQLTYPTWRDGFRIGLG